MLDLYTGANSKMKFKCKECGHEWITSYHAVLGSTCGCPCCGVKKAFRKRSISYIKSHLSSNFEFISYKDPYHITVKCTKCGCIRTTSTSNLMKYGCKNCSSKIANEHKKLTIEQFIKLA